MVKKIVKRKVKIPVIMPFLEREKAVAEKTKASILKHNPDVQVIMVDGTAPSDLPSSKKLTWVFFNRVVPAYRDRGFRKGFYYVESGVKIKKPFKEWIKEQQDLLQGLGRDAKTSSDPNIRRLYWDTETYIFNLQRYLNDGVYRDHRYGAEKQNKIRHRCVGMAYYPDGTPKRTPGVFYYDIGEEYTNEMAAEDHARAKQAISNKKRVRKIN